MRDELTGTSPGSMGVYVHFPYCLEKCPYCDFVSVQTPRDEIDHDGYADAVIRELSARAPAFAGLTIASVFIGGGTPSLFAPSALARVLGALFSSFRATDGDLEVTIECNPTSAGDDPDALFSGLVAAGVNRLSIGVQSLDDARLRFLGRRHDAASARRAIRAAVGTGARVSADLIYGLPGQRPAEAAEHACALVDLGLDHLSAYALTIEEGTRFGELARAGRLPIAVEDEVCDAFEAVGEGLARRGLSRYEVSNYARRGSESRHNLGYWRGAPYLGLGCAAVGFGFFPGAPSGAIGVRYRNAVDPPRYVAATRAVVPGVPHEGDGLSASAEPIDAEAAVRERIFLGLRLEAGVDLDQVATDLGLPSERVWTPERLHAIDRAVLDGLVVRDGGRIRIPEGKRLLTDGISSRLF